MRHFHATYKEDEVFTPQPINDNIKVNIFNDRTDIYVNDECSTFFTLLDAKFFVNFYYLDQQAKVN